MGNLCPHLAIISCKELMYIHKQNKMKNKKQILIVIGSMIIGFYLLGLILTMAWYVIYGIFIFAFGALVLISVCAAIKYAVESLGRTTTKTTTTNETQEDHVQGED